MGMRLACVNLDDIICSYSAAMATGLAPCFLKCSERGRTQKTHEMAKPLGLVLCLVVLLTLDERKNTAVK